MVNDRYPVGKRFKVYIFFFNFQRGWETGDGFAWYKMKDKIYRAKLEHPSRVGGQLTDFALFEIGVG